MRNSKNKLKNKKNQENSFYPDEIVDIVNENEKISYEGKIISIKGNLIIVQNMHNGNTESYNNDEGKVLKIWRLDRPLQKYNRVDFNLNNNNFFVEATVTNINYDTNEITVKYRNNNRYKPLGEDKVKISSERIFPVGLYTKNDNFKEIENNILNSNSSEKPKNNSLLGQKTQNPNKANVFVVLKDEQEVEFRKLLKKINLEIKKVSGDGNCLFRAISDQIYGTDEYYALIREKCMDYIEVQKRFFREFIDGDFDEYIKNKRKDGIWGDDIELEAISEIYNRPIEIYSGSQKPLKCFHEDKCYDNNRYISTPIRLSYHGQKHYNSVIPLEEAKFKFETYKNSLIKTKPGKYEDKAIGIAINNEKNLDKGIDLSEEEHYLRLKKNLSGKKKEDILEEKIQELNKIPHNINNQFSDEESKNKKVKNDNQDKKDVKIKENLRKEKEESNNIIKNNKENQKEKEEKKEEKDNNELDPIIKKLLELGYDYEDAVEAFLLYEDQELAVNYLLSKHSKNNDENAFFYE